MLFTCVQSWTSLKRVFLCNNRGILFSTLPRPKRYLESCPYSSNALFSYYDARGAHQYNHGWTKLPSNRDTPPPKPLLLHINPHFSPLFTPISLHQILQWQIPSLTPIYISSSWWRKCAQINRGCFDKGDIHYQSHQPFWVLRKFHLQAGLTERQPISTSQFFYIPTVPLLLLTVEKSWGR